MIKVDNREIKIKNERKGTLFYLLSFSVPLRCYVLLLYMSEYYFRLFRNKNRK